MSRVSFSIFVMFFGLYGVCPDCFADSVSLGKFFLAGQTRAIHVIMTSPISLQLSFDEYCEGGNKTGKPDSDVDCDPPNFFNDSVQVSAICKNGNPRGKNVGPIASGSSLGMSWYSFLEFEEALVPVCSSIELKIGGESKTLAIPSAFPKDA